MTTVCHSRAEKTLRCDPDARERGHHNAQGYEGVSAVVHIRRERRASRILPANLNVAGSCIRTHWAD
jgi:hypothetical protein